MRYTNNYAARSLLMKAREFRTNPTRAESLLWSLFRNRRLGGYKIRRQHVIHGKIVDFFCRDALLIIEVDGDVHGTPEMLPSDAQRDAEFESIGYYTLRIRNDEVLSNTAAVCKRVLDCIDKRVALMVGEQSS